MRAAKEGILSYSNALAEAYTMSVIFSQCTNINIEKLINEKEGITPEEKEEARAWAEEMTLKWKEEQELRKRLRDLSE